MNTNKKLPYDKTSPRSIEEYAENLIGKNFYDILRDYFAEDKGENLYEAQTEYGSQPVSKLDETVEYYNNPNCKGGLGNLLEKYYFFYEPNSNPEPDFAEAGTELKLMPYEITKTKKYRAGERLVLTMIPNHEPIDKDFDKSALLSKMRLILLILYLRDRTISRTQYGIDYVKLFSILSKECKDDLKVIKEDYKTIVDKIIAGKAHEISEGDTRYLGACTKGGNAKSSIQPQYYSDIPAKRRAFSLKQGYMTYVLNHYIRQDICTYDAAFSSGELDNVEFDTEIVKRINKYIGWTENSIYKEFKLSGNTKQKNNQAICRMLGVKTDRVAEFEKADIKIKTIRLKKNGVPKESMSFPTMVIKDFVNETFEDSEIYQYFSRLRFLFVVFKEDNDEVYRLAGAKFWNMPITELETTGREEWEMIRNKFKDGVNFTVGSDKRGQRIYNDLPKIKDSKMFHVRPHTQNSAYVINGIKYGKGKDRDMDELPNGDKMTKQCFWLNSNYVANIIKNLSK